MCTNDFFFFFKCWKTIPPLYCLAMDPRIKFETVENTLNFIAICMNQQSKPKGKIYKQLNNLCKYYLYKYGNVSSSTKTSSTFGNDQFFIQLVKENDKLVLQVGIIFQNI